MTHEAQRIAIAEACGWTSLRLVGEEPMGRPPLTTDRYETVPDYLTDLNAMHEAENWLRTKGVVWVDYENRIGKCASAAQRAEAFLRTLNLWKPPCAT